MTLVDLEAAERLYGAMGPAVEVSGGSAANTMAGIAALGGSAGFVGKVADDPLARSSSMTSAPPVWPTTRSSTP